MTERVVPQRPPEARVIEVIEVRSLRGSGVQTDPYRLVTSYYAPDGTPLAEKDPSIEPLIESTGRVVL